MWTSKVVERVQSGQWAFATILVGTREDNDQFVRDLNDTPGKQGWNVLASMTEAELEADLGTLGRWLDDHELDRAVITTPMSTREAMLGWVAVLEGKGVELLVVPGALDYMAGTVRSSNLFGVPLVNLSRTGLGQGMKALKRFVDVLGSALALVLLSPILAWVAWRSSGGLTVPSSTAKSALDSTASPFTSSSSARWWWTPRAPNPS